MLRPILILLLLLPPLTAQSKRQSYALPKNKKAVVLSLDYAGGYTPLRQKHAPFLSIQADGTVHVREVFDKSAARDLQDKITAVELQKLLRFVIEEQKLGKWDKAELDKILAERKAAGKAAVAIEDASSTVIQLSIPGHKVKAEMYALGFAAKNLPGVAMVQRLKKTQDRLHHLAAVIRGGGRAYLEKMLVTLNKSLKGKFPKDAPLKVKDLSHVSRPAKGGMTLVFIRLRGKSKSLYASLTVDADGKTTARIQEIDR